MNELLKLLINRLLGWPIAAIVICLIFRSGISRLLSEFTAFFQRASQLSVRHKDVSVEASTVANLQVKRDASDSNEFDLGAGAAITVSKVTISDENIAQSEDVLRERNALVDYGKGVMSVQVREDSIKSELQRLGFNLDQLETTEMLIRQLATQQCLTFFERTYRVIFGSQISAMEFLNTQGPVKASLVEAFFFDTARNLEEAFYAGSTFDQWLAFLLSNLLIAQEGEDLGITVGGRDFLVWMVNTGLASTRPH